MAVRSPASTPLVSTQHSSAQPLAANTTLCTCAAHALPHQRPRPQLT
jgi:hypothetical protein